MYLDAKHFKALTLQMQNILKHLHYFRGTRKALICIEVGMPIDNISGQAAAIMSLSLQPGLKTKLNAPEVSACSHEFTHPEYNSHPNRTAT